MLVSYHRQSTLSAAIDIHSFFIKSERGALWERAMGIQKTRLRISFTTPPSYYIRNFAHPPPSVAALLQALYAYQRRRSLQPGCLQLSDQYTILPRSAASTSGTRPDPGVFFLLHGAASGRPVHGQDPSLLFLSSNLVRFICRPRPDITLM